MVLKRAQWLYLIHIADLAFWERLLVVLILVLFMSSGSACYKFFLNKIGKDSDASKYEEEDLLLKVGECLEERVKERSSRPKDTLQFTSSVQPFENVKSKNDTGIGSAASFSEDEDTAQILSSANRGRKGSLTASRSSRVAPQVGKSKISTRGRGRGRGRGSSGLKQTTLDARLGFRHSQRSASAAVQSIADDEENVDSASSEEYGINEENDEIVQGKGRKRVAPRGRGRGSTSKQGRKSDDSLVHKVFMNKHDDDDDDDAEEIARRFNKSQPRVTKSYGALRR